MKRKPSGQKKCIDDLALFGGSPAFETTLHVGRPNIPSPDRLAQLFRDVIDSGRITNHGPFVQGLERRIAEFLGVRNCILVCNATAGLEILVRALDLEGEVVIPSLTFIATAHCLQWQGIRPIFCDVDPETHNIDPRALEYCITPKTTGVIGVHLWGRPCDVAGLRRICDSRGVKLIFDAAHAFSCSMNGQRVGAFGEAEVFSFHATKFLSTMEGGAITTNNDRLAEKISLMRNFGFRGLDNVVSVGINAKMSEVSAVYGIASLEELDSLIRINRRNYLLYQKLLEKLPGIKVVVYDEEEENNYQYVVFELSPDSNYISRDDLVRALHTENIRARRYFYPGCHGMEPYRTLYPDTKESLPVTEALVKKLVCLPTGTSISEENIETVCHLIEFMLRNGERVTAQLLEP